MIDVQKCDGPECPDCGCQDTETTTPRKAGSAGWFAESARQRCNHCGRQWIPDAALAQSIDQANEIGPPDRDAVIYHVIRCPACRGKNTHVASTRRPIRQHKCDDCGHPFKSIEREPE